MNSRENIVFSILHKVGCSHKDLHILSNFRGNPEEILEKFLQKDPSLLLSFWEKKFEKISKNLEKFDIEKYEDFLHQNSIRIISFLDDDYPDALKHIFQIPFLLYTKGNIKTQENTIAIVWSRKNSNYGTSALGKITENLPKNISIISGWAYGIDSLSHEIAIEKWLHTIAVFGCGINIVYPKTNSGLFTKILENNGGIISIFPIDTPPEAYNFPIRNEIVAWLSEKILIPEAGVKSGTLITARLANELGKEVYAVPGDIFRSTSEGCNLLISSGEAQCTISAADIFPELSLQTGEKQWEIPIFWMNENTENKIEQQKIFTKNFDSEIAERIFTHISEWKNSIDLLIIATNEPIETIGMELTLLEIGGHIRQNSPGLYECIFN